MLKIPVSPLVCTVLRPMAKYRAYSNETGISSEVKNGADILAS